MFSVSIEDDNIVLRFGNSGGLWTKAPGGSEVCCANGVAVGFRAPITNVHDAMKQIAKEDETWDFDSPLAGLLVDYSGSNMVAIAATPTRLLLRTTKNIKPGDDRTATSMKTYVCQMASARIDKSRRWSWETATWVDNVEENV